MSTKTFRQLHDEFLLLPNAWDAGSARLIESLGAQAIATTSAGVAWSHGYRDGDTLPSEALLATAREIARVIKIPLTVDIEGGYSDEPSDVGQLVKRVIEAGAVGINLEDGASPPELFCRKIEAARKSSEQAGADLFINVRSDVILRELVPESGAGKEIVRRACSYREAGGDGLFVPGLADGAVIEEIARAIQPTPLNIMLVAGLPDFATLRKQGVRRLSAGAAIAQASLALTRRLTQEFCAGNWSKVLADGVEYGPTNALFPSVAKGRL